MSTNKTQVRIHDLDNKAPSLTLKPYQQIHISSTFEKDGIVYGRPYKVAKQFLWYGVPENILEPYDELFKTNKTLAERVVTKSTKWSDYPVLFMAKIEKWFDIK